MKALSGAFFAAFLSTQVANAEPTSNIGNLESGFYNGTDQNGAVCLLAVGNSGTFNGRGYAALDCENGADLTTLEIPNFEKINDTNIGELSTGAHHVKVIFSDKVVGCDVLIGRSGFLRRSSGFAVMQCHFSN